MIKRQVSMLPDWSVTANADEAREFLQIEKFLGPGWYYRGPDTVLVLPPEQNWKQKWPTDTRFLLLGYLNRNPQPIMHSIVMAPTRIDERECCQFHSYRIATSALHVPCAPNGRIPVCDECAAEENRERTFQAYYDQHADHVHRHKNQNA